MGASVSRRRLARVVVDRLEILPKSRVLGELAAYLHEEGLVNQLDLFMQEIEAEYASRGHVVADVTSARALDDTSRSELVRFIKENEGAGTVELRESTDSELIGGAIIQTPGKYFDGSLKRRLNQLKTTSRT